MPTGNGFALIWNIPSRTIRQRVPRGNLASNPSLIIAMQRFPKMNYWSAECCEKPMCWWWGGAEWRMTPFHKTLECVSHIHAGCHYMLRMWVRAQLFLFMHINPFQNIKQVLRDQSGLVSSRPHNNSLGCRNHHRRPAALSPPSSVGAE